jgi:hypothetical protein
VVERVRAGQVKDLSELPTDEFQTWIISQAIRNELEMFHGGGAYDPEHPDSGEGFITDSR